MFRILISIALLGLTPTAAAALSSAPPASAAATQDQPAEYQAWLERLIGWNSGYVDLVTRRSDQSLGLMDGGEHMQQLLESGKTGEARIWAQRWAAETRAAYAALNSEYATLAVEPPPPPAGADPAEARALMRQQSDFRDRVGTLLRQSADSAEVFIGRVVAAASGRDADRLALGKGYFELGITEIQTENLMLLHSRPDESQPGYYYSVSLMATNEAAIAWMVYMRDSALALDVDPAASATEIREQARIAEEAANTLKVRVERLGRQVAAAPELVGTPLRGNLLFIMESMSKSADIELAIAAEFRKIADAVASGDVEAAGAAYTPIEGLVAQRIAGDAERRARLSDG